MIYFIQGKLVEKAPTSVVVEINGIAYLASVPLSTYENLGAVGSTVKLFTRLYVRDDTLELFGFGAQEEKKFFELLITIPGVGPKVALRVLSGMTPYELQQAVMSEQVPLLSKIPGIGKKTAERIILELKGPIEKLSLTGDLKQVPETFSDAVEALVILGYKRSAAASVVRKVMVGSGEPKNLEDIIREALKKI